MRAKRVLIILAVLSYCISFSSCGMHLKNEDQSGNPAVTAAAEAYQSVFGNASASTQATATAGGSCTDKWNVEPYDKSFLKTDGTYLGYFKVCGTGNSSEIILYGEAQNGTTDITVFPANSISDDEINAITFKDSSNHTHVFSMPAKTDPNGAKVTFDKQVFNSVFVVEKRYADDMEACLLLQNAWICPPYSYGKFR